MRRLAVVSLVALLALVSYVLWTDPWKQSALFVRLLDMSNRSDKKVFSLVDETHAVLISAEHEVRALLEDGFYPEAIGVIKEPLLCGTAVLPANSPISFVRKGMMLRMDRYTYEIRIVVDDLCMINRADGILGRIVLP